MAMRGAQVKVGAVQAAWDQACVLRSGDDLEALPELAERIATATAAYGAGELLRGTVFLISGALEQIGAGHPGGEQFAAKFTKTLMNKILHWAEVVEPTDLPMVRQVVTVAFEGRDPVAWRDQAGPVPDSEPRAMTCALALIADFVDRVDGPGACEHALLTSLGSALD
ncbi:hypothetical protein [Streptomyces malaysiensis]|uniref:Uncharacterized protein n=1 Tax=Streptomyces malaysiensis subsp. samsunensis TaxID=459658 RepID=A0A9X2S134_STRMQ|nr:hypothetical protein [Streptomyces samsunensis]MCQ8835814.1 hypothetical protein [Streptomyces samsunensis]